MKKIAIIFSVFLISSCHNFGQLKVVANLSKKIKEVSGTEVVLKSDLIWMINDSGNKPILFGLNEKGEIIKDIYIKSKNHDWEDLTSDQKGNIYIGDFGNNQSTRKNLRILKVSKKYLKKKNAEVEKIEFEYENQHKFPPKKKELYFDSEAFFYFKNFFYIFTKSRVKNNYGKTFLYKLPAKKGKHIARLIGEFENCNDLECWVTSADINNDGSKIVLLTQKNILIFSDFKNDDFFSGKLKTIALEYRTQKEGITFKDKNTLLITDEKAHGEGGNLYELKIN